MPKFLQNKLLQKVKAWWQHVHLQPAQLNQSPTPTPAGPLIEQLRHTLFQVDQAGRFQYLSPQWQQLTGYSPMACYGEHIWAYSHPTQSQSMTQWLEQYAHASPPTKPLQLHLIHQQGHAIWVEMHASSWFDENGRTIGITGTLLDITEARQTQRQQAAAYRTLMTIADHFEGMLFRCRNNQAWSMEYVSAGCQQLTGYAEEQLMSADSNLAYAQLIHEDDHQRVWHLVQSSLQNNQSWRIAYRINTALGEQKWVWEQGRGIFSDTEQLLFLEGIIYDITQSKLADPLFKQTALFNSGTDYQASYRLLTELQQTYSQDKVLLMQLKVDNLSHIEATYGAEFCNRLMLQVQGRIEQIMPTHASLCRYHTDQLLVSYPLQLEPTSEVHLRQLRQHLIPPLHVDKLDIYISLSIGWLCLKGRQWSLYETLRDLDLATAYTASLGGGQTQEASHELRRLHSPTQALGWP